MRIRRCGEDEVCFAGDRAGRAQLLLRDEAIRTFVGTSRYGSFLFGQSSAFLRQHGRVLRTTDLTTLRQTRTVLRQTCTVLRETCTVLRQHGGGALRQHGAVPLGTVLQTLDNGVGSPGGPRGREDAGHRGDHWLGAQCTLRRSHRDVSGRRRRQQSTASARALLGESAGSRANRGLNAIAARAGSHHVLECRRTTTGGWRADTIRFRGRGGSHAQFIGTQRHDRLGRTFGTLYGFDLAIVEIQQLTDRTHPSDAGCAKATDLLRANEWA